MAVWTGTLPDAPLHSGTRDVCCRERSLPLRSSKRAGFRTRVAKLTPSRTCEAVTAILFDVKACLCRGAALSLETAVTILTPEPWPDPPGNPIVNDGAVSTEDCEPALIPPVSRSVCRRIVSRQSSVHARRLPTLFDFKASVVKE